MQFSITIDLSEEELKILLSALASYYKGDDTFWLGSTSKYTPSENEAFISLRKRNLILNEEDFYYLSWTARLILNR